MSDDKKYNDQIEQKGVSRFTASVGQSSIDSTIFGGVAAVAGAAVGALSHDKEAHVAAVKNINGMLNINKSNAPILSSVKDAIRRAELKELVKANKISWKDSWNHASRGGKAIFAAALAAIPVFIIASFTGAFRGGKKADEAKEQFKEITGENKNLKEKLADTETRLSSSENKLSASEASIAQIKSALTKQPEQEKSHVADLNAERAAQASQVVQAAI